MPQTNSNHRCSCPGCSELVFAGRLCFDHWKFNLESHEPTDVIMSRSEAQKLETQEFEIAYVVNPEPDQWSRMVKNGWCWMSEVDDIHRFMRTVQK